MCNHGYQTNAININILNSITNFKINYEIDKKFDENYFRIGFKKSFYRIWGLISILYRQSLPMTYSVKISDSQPNRTQKV